MKNFLETIQARRSIYGIGKGSPIGDGRIIDLLETAVRYNPSAFHMQSARVLLLLNGHHDRFWDIVLETLRRVVEPGAFEPTRMKIEGFAAGHGTVLFFEDQKVAGAYGETHSLYQDKIPGFALQSNGMLQFSVWNLLEAEGLGASLQHYNPLIDEKVREEWAVPQHWQLIAQMPFGEVLACPEELQRRPMEELMKIFR